MDVIEQLGPLALASRLRRLADRLQKDVSQVYRDLDVTFEARWFAVVFYLKNHTDGVPLTTVASDLGLSHPAVNQVAGQMSRRGLLQSGRDPGDYRRRLLSLTHEGRETVKALEPVWAVIAEATGELSAISGDDLIGSLQLVEQSLEQRSMYDRVTSRLRERNLLKPGS